MNTNPLARAWDAVFHPKARLSTDFPWDLGKSAKTYGMALVVYFVATFASALALVGLVWLTGLYDSALPVRIMTDHYLPFLVIASIVSFIAGFGAEVWYLKRQLGKDKLSFKKLVGLNLDSLGGSKWSALWRGVVTWLIIIVVDKLVGFIPMPEVVDPAADFLRSLSGWPLYALAVLVVVGPIFEELVFRGFLYNVTRSSMLKNGTAGRVTADVVALVVSSAAFSIMHFNLSGFLAYFIAGAVLAESYRRSGSLYVPIVAHMLNNGTAVLLLLLS